MKATTVPVLVFTVAPFQWRHNAGCNTEEWLERLSMRFKLGTLIRSESQSEKGSGRVRMGGDASLLPVLVGLALSNNRTNGTRVLSSGTPLQKIKFPHVP